MNRELAASNLRLVKEVLDEFGIEFWLDAGTLLGAIRDGEIIEWDNDIDLCMWNDDRKKLFLVLHELKRRKIKFKLAHPLYPNVGWVALKLFPFDCNIDILLWQVEDDKLTNLTNRLEESPRLINSILYLLRIARHYLYCDLSLSVHGQTNKCIAKIFEHSLPLLPMKLKTFLLEILQRWKLGYTNWFFITPKRYFEKLGTIQFYGLKFHIPFNVEDYLKYHYGNWKIPEKKWDYWKDDLAPMVKVCQTLAPDNSKLYWKGDRARMVKVCQTLASNNSKLQNHK
jgi:lipopolysaccharide cholinephosphotransferase